jgi:hypothetical protein
VRREERESPGQVSDRYNVVSRPKTSHVGHKEKPMTAIVQKLSTGYTVIGAGAYGPGGIAGERPTR